MGKFFFFFIVNITFDEHTDETFYLINVVSYEVRPILLSLSYLEVFPVHEYNTSLIVLDITALDLILELTAMLIIIPSHENEYALYPYPTHIDALLLY